MATVYISKTFIQDVKDHISSMRKDELRHKCGDSTALGLQPPADGRYRFLELLTWGPEYLRYADELPKRWVTSTTRCDLATVISDGETKRKVSIVTQFVKNDTRFPPMYNGLIDTEFPAEYLTDREMLATYPELAEIAAFFEKMKVRGEINGKWNKTENEVVAYFNACPSLNKALLLQPAMRMYVPREYLTKLDKVTVRTERVIPEIDGAALAAQAVEVQLARAIGGGQ